MTIQFTMPFIMLSKSNSYRVCNNRFFKTKELVAQEIEIKKLISAALPVDWVVSTKQFKVEVHMQYCDKRRRDVDGAAKAILDCMNGLVYKDDNLVMVLHMEKELGAATSSTTVTATEL